VKESSAATADLLRKLADSYVREGQVADDEAEADRAEYDLGPVEDGPRVGRAATEIAPVPQRRDYIKSLRVAGLKSFERATLSLSPLTVVIGEIASGKSTLAEALALLRRAAGPRFVDEIDELFSGMGSLLRAGTRELDVAVTIGDVDGSVAELAYEMTVVRETSGRARVLHDRLLDVSAGKTRLLSDARLAERHRGGESDEARAAFHRVTHALRRLEVHVGFDVASSWAARAAARGGGARDAAPPAPGDRVHLFGSSLASAYAALRTRPTWSTELLPDVKRVLTDAVDLRVRPEARTGNPVLTVARGAQDTRTDELSGGELAWLALIATLALAEGTRTLVVLDEPTPMIPVALVAPLLERYASRGVRLLYLTSARAILDRLSNPERDVRLSARGPQGRSILEPFCRP